MAPPLFMDNAQLINQTSGNVEYRTPMHIIEAAHRVMGGIDLDPASADWANQYVGAKMIYTKEQNGLAYDWAGRVWMNHPFSKPERKCSPDCKKKSCSKRGYHLEHDIQGNAAWIGKLIHDYRHGFIEEALCITFASTSEKWFKPLMSYPQCYLQPRTEYLTRNGEALSGVTKGSVITWLAHRSIYKFADAFSKLGSIMVPF